MNHENYVQLELLQQQLTELDQTMQQAAQQIDHAMIANQTLESLKTANPGQELLVPLGNGIFLPVEVKDAKKLRVVVGANVAVEKNPEDTQSALLAQLESLEEYYKQSVNLYNQVIEKINEVQDEIEKEKQGSN